MGAPVGQKITTDVMSSLSKKATAGSRTDPRLGTTIQLRQSLGSQTAKLYRVRLRRVRMRLKPVALEMLASTRPQLSRIGQRRTGGIAKDRQAAAARPKIEKRRIDTIDDARHAREAKRVRRPRRPSPS